jgi:O-antigen ligase
MLSAYTTFARAVWLGLLVQGAGMIYLLRRRRILLAGLGGILLVILLLPGQVFFHGEKPLAPEELVEGKVGGTAGDLIEVWRHWGNWVLCSPFEGIGFGRHSFSKKFKEFRSTHQPLLWHAHNTFLDISYQLGIQGLLAFLFLLYTLGRQAWRTYRDSPDPLVKRAGLALLLMMCGFFVRNFFDDFYVDDSALLFWLLAGFTISLRRGFKERASEVKA